jgi:hypothetical protein
MGLVVPLGKRERAIGECVEQSRIIHEKLLFAGWSG